MTLDHCAIGVPGWDAANRSWRDLVGAGLVGLPRGLWAYRCCDAHHPVPAHQARRSEYAERLMDRAGEPTGRRGVALDLDGVLIDGMQFHVAAWEAAFGRYGLAVDPDDFFLLEGINTSDVVARITRQHSLGLSPEQQADITRLKRDFYAASFRVVSLDGAAALVNLFHSLSYTLALVTGTTAQAGERSLAELGLRESFSCVVSGDQVKRGKPAPDSYLRAVELLGVRRTDCLAVENAPAGIDSAQRAHIPCVAVATYLSPEKLSHAEHVFPDLTRLTSWAEAEARRSGGSGPFLLPDSGAPPGPGE